MRPQPLIAVTDVEAGSRFYQRLLGCESAHGGKEYEHLVAKGALVLPLRMLAARSRWLYGRPCQPGWFGRMKFC